MNPTKSNSIKSFTELTITFFLLWIFAFSFSGNAEASDSIVGSWYGQNFGPAHGDPAGDTDIATFLANGQFFIVHDFSSTLQPSLQSGIDYGTYSWNNATDAFSATDLGNTTNVGGIHGVNNISVSGSTLTLVNNVKDPQDNGLTLTSTPNVYNSFLGSWYVSNAGLPNETILYTFLTNGEVYAYAGGNVNGLQGITVASYAIDSVTGNFTIDAIQATTIGTALLLPGYNGNVSVNGNQASFTAGNGDLVTLSRVVAPVPLPAAASMFLVGLMGFLGLSQKQKS